MCFMGSYDEGVPQGTLFSASTTSGALSTKTTPIDPTELPLITLPLHLAAGAPWSSYHVTGQTTESL